MAATINLVAFLYSVAIVGFPDVWKWIRDDNTRASDKETTTTTTTCSLLIINKIEKCWLTVNLLLMNSRNFHTTDNWVPHSDPPVNVRPLWSAAIMQ